MTQTQSSTVVSTDGIVQNQTTTTASASTSLIPSEKPAPLRVLTLDGGGIRGWWQILVALAIQDKMRELTGKPVNLGEHVNVFAGTSVGAMIASALSRGKMNLDDLKKILETEGGSIFNHTFFKRISSLFGLRDEIYDKSYLETRLKEIHGADTRLADIEKDLVVVAHNSTQQKTEIMSTFSARKEVQKNEAVKTEDVTWRKNKKVAKVVLASASAPVYFQGEQDELTKDMLVDGGLDANNPVLAAFSILTKHKGPEALTYHYVSIGTGRPSTKREFNPDLGAEDYVPQLMDLCMDGNSQCTAQMAKKIFGNRFVRLNIILPEKVAMDGVDTANFQKMKVAYDAFIENENNKQLILRAAKLLLPTEEE
ncbi:MAG: patatin-like phospholipase family protein [Candidatus Nucleicultricaceae bacterium]